MLMSTDRDPPHHIGDMRATNLQMMRAILATGAIQERQSFEQLELRMEMRMESMHRRERELGRNLQLARFGFM